MQKAIRDTLLLRVISSVCAVAQALHQANPIGSRVDRGKGRVATVIAEDIEQAEPSANERARALTILAKSLYRELTAQGYDQKHIVNLATALLGEVTSKGAIQHS